MGEVVFVCVEKSKFKNKIELAKFLNVSPGIFEFERSLSLDGKDALIAGIRLGTVMIPPHILLRCYKNK